MLLLEATPPAITKIFFLILLFFLNSLNAILLFLYNISLIVSWNEAARLYFSLSDFIVLEIFKTAVFKPANDRLHPPLLIIGLGKE